MPEIVKLDNPILNYEWGSRSAIGEFLGRRVPTTLPEAEVWIGDHPRAPSRVWVGEGRSPIAGWIAQSPGAVLGQADADETAHHLPFLVKLLAAADPLSVQVHPNATQASAGFASEERARLPIDDATRSYRDPAQKHEIFVALSHFQALCGLRQDEDLRDRVAQSGLPVLQGLLSKLESITESRLASSLLLRVVALEASHRRQLGGELQELGAADGPEDSAEARWVADLRDRFPGDPLAVAPLLLNLVTLEPHEALVVAPGTVHSYLEGFGVEVMTRSDNVIRVGLTSKHVDSDELRKVMCEEATEPLLVSATVCSPERREYPTGTDAFQIAMETIAGERPLARASRSGVEILLCIEGNVELCRQVGGPSVQLRRGEAALIPACVEDCQVLGKSRILRITGSATPLATGPRETGE